MTEIHAFDPDGTPSPGAQTALANAVEGIPDASGTQRGLMAATDVARLGTAATNALRAEKGRPARASVAYGTHQGNPYSVVRVFDAIRPGVIAKSLGGAFENQGKTGTQLVPSMERLRSYTARTGYPIAANADGWRVDGNVGEMRGPQIIDGQILHEFGNPTESVHQGIEAVGIRGDGTYQHYSVRDGDTAQSMVDDGVVTSFSYGPQIVRDGAIRDITDSYWSQFHTTLSARQVIGYAADGTFLIITVTGVSHASGISGIACGPLAASLGVRDAWLMDGGGSAHTAAGSAYVMPSSDAGCERAVPSALLVNADLPPIVSPWYPVTIQNAAMAAWDTPPLYRIAGDRFEFQGGVKMADGSKVPGTNNYALKFPFRPAWQGQAHALYTGLAIGKVSCRTDGQLNVYGDNSVTAYLTLDNLRVPYLA